MADTKIVKVIDRNGKELVQFEKIPSNATVEEFKKVLIKDCNYLSKDLDKQIIRSILFLIAAHLTLHAI